MKKLFYFLAIPVLLSAVLFNGCKQKTTPQGNKNQNVQLAETLEILPTMDSVSHAKNQVWVGTFQLVWNDMINELLKTPVEFENYKSITAENLNKQVFTSDGLSANAYYKKWGEAVPALKAEMEQAIKEKFNETSEVLDQVQWDSTPQDPKYVLYAMLKKDFEFLEKFAKLDDGKFKGSEEDVKYFGIKDDSFFGLRQSLDVLFYDNPKNFAVALKTKQNDIVYIYRNNDNKTLDVLYKDMLSKAAKYKGNKNFTGYDKFKVPVIDYKGDTEFSEFYGKAIKGTDFTIDKAIETIEFKMDETGVKLKSEALIHGKTLGIYHRETLPTRYFNADGPFVIFIEESAKKPYFAMKVTDAAKLQKQIKQTAVL